MEQKQMITKVLPFEVKEVAHRTLEFVGSTEDKDREGDIIMSSGWQLKQYKKNPVFMWAHQYADPPIGKAVEVWAGDGKLKFHIQFAEKEEYEFADTVYKLYKGGYLRASSVGFIPIKSEPIEVKEDEDNFCFHQPTRYLKQELLELSGCPVPANPNALAEAKAKGLIKDLWRFMPVIEGDPEKPYPNEHACRLRNPDDFQADSFRRSAREHEGKEYSVIMGKLTGEDNMTDQAFRYDKEVWTASEAKSHCKDHEGTFEPASEKVEDAVGTPLTEKEVKEDRFGDLEKAISQANMGDELDYLIHAIANVGVNKDNMPMAWELVRIIMNVMSDVECAEEMRESGSDIPVDIAEKIGAVLNRVNGARLEKIKTLAQEVLDSAKNPEVEPEKSLSPEEIGDIFANVLTVAIDKAKGKLGR